MAAVGLRIKADSNLQRDRSSIGTIDMVEKKSGGRPSGGVELPSKEPDQDLVEEDP